MNPTRDLESKWEKQEHRDRMEGRLDAQPVKIRTSWAPHDWHACYGCDWAFPDPLPLDKGTDGKFCSAECEAEYYERMAYEQRILEDEAEAAELGLTWRKMGR